jgi:hypothetical protein
LGVRYTITPFGEDHNQSDIATLTNDIRFHGGFSRFYPAGTEVTFAGAKWTAPPGSASYRFFQQNWAIMVPLWVLTFIMGNVLFMVKWFRHRPSKVKTASTGHSKGSRHEGGVEPPQPGL